MLLPRLVLLALKRELLESLPKKAGWLRGRVARRSAVPQPAGLGARCCACCRLLLEARVSDPSQHCCLRAMAGTELPRSCESACSRCGEAAAA